MSQIYPDDQINNLVLLIMKKCFKCVFNLLGNNFFKNIK